MLPTTLTLGEAAEASAPGMVHQHLDQREREVPRVTVDTQEAQEDNTPAVYPNPSSSVNGLQAQKAKQQPQIEDSRLTGWPNDPEPQDAVTKTIPKKKKCKKEKWLSEEALQIAEKRREVKKQGKKGKIYPTEYRVPENSKGR